MDEPTLIQVMKNGPMRWTDENDIVFVREVLAHEPYTQRKGSPERKRIWENLANTLNAYEKLSFRVTARSVRDRLNLLLDNFKRKMAEEKRASGIDCEESEVDNALQDILERFQEAEKSTAQRKAAIDSDAKKALEMRKRSLETFSETKERSSEETTPKRSRNNGSETITYLKEKSTVELEFRREELKVTSQLRKDELDARREEQKNMKDQFTTFQQQQNLMFQKLSEQHNNTLALMQQSLNAQQQQQSLLLALIQKTLEK